MVDFVKNWVVGDRCGGKADLSLQEVSDDVEGLKVV